MTCDVFAVENMYTTNSWAEKKHITKLAAQARLDEVMSKSDEWVMTGVFTPMSLPEMLSSKGIRNKVRK